MIKALARRVNRQPPIWDGIYESFAQAPVSGDGFDGKPWLSDMEQYTKRAVESIGNGDAGIPENVPPYHALFSLLVSSLAPAEGKIRVLDFGGGMGIGFANLRHCLAAKTDLEYLIVDNEESCERGRQLLRNFSSVKFLSKLPPEPGTIDVLVLSGVVQFVDDYEELLTRLAALKPTFWLFTFVPAGDIPTFVSTQRNVPGSVIPVWFFNLRELVEKVESRGYRLIFKAALERVFDMSNFPLSYQLTRQCNLLFRRQ